MKPMKASSASRLLAVVVCACSAAARAAPVRIGSESRLREHPRSRYSRFVNRRPADKEVVKRNPPRFSWPYDPGWPEQPQDALHDFRLQIAETADFSAPLVDVSCQINMYNALPVLQGATTWYWRVGYDLDSPTGHWSSVQSFRIAADALDWDRTALAAPDFERRGHPRILFNQDNLNVIRDLATTNPDSAAALAAICRKADAILQKPWWADFPETDTDTEPKQAFYTIAGDLVTVAFAWTMTQEERYAGVLERAVTWASYPAGGRASPEGLGGDGNEDATQGNEFLALLFDWLYNQLNPAQRRTMIQSLAWRVDHIMNRFAWKRPGRNRGAMLRLTFGNAADALTLPAESFDLAGKTDVVRAQQASTGRAVRLVSEDAVLSRTVHLEPGSYVIKVRGCGPQPDQDAFHLRFAEAPPKRLFIQSWGEASSRITVEQAADHTLSLAASAGETGMLIDTVTISVHGDQRRWLEPTAEWTEFTWEVMVPPAATHLAIEPFNYYSKGEVCWDTVSVKDADSDVDYVKNPDFEVSAGARTRPRNWAFHAFGTEAESRFDTTAGHDDTGVVVIACTDGDQRGAWHQRIPLEQARKLIVTGRYRTTVKDNTSLVRATSLSGQCSSHQYEASMDTAACALALYEHHPLGKEWFDLIANYLAGVTCGFGFDESWNEGAGYGTSKCKWLMNATLYMDTALPGIQFGRNPFYSRIGDWFSRIIPVGMDHHAWGNQANASRGNHLAHYRKFAYLTGEGRFLLNWQEYGGEGFSSWRPWIEYVLPAYYTRPEPVPEERNTGLFPIGGWVMAATGPPSLRSTYEEGLGFIFQCRPRGGYGHSFNSDGSFQLHAYGQMLNHGGGSSANKDAYAYHTMSHHTILVDGLGQAQPSRGMTQPTYARLVGYAETDKLVYTAGDISGCYPETPGNYRRWGLPLQSVYEQRALPHLQHVVRHILFVKGRYVVIFDDLAATEPATFTWLYHILPEAPFELDSANAEVRYAVDDVRVRLRHLARPDQLVFDDRKGEAGLINPFTEEDYTSLRKGDILCGHNLWISNAVPAKHWTFLAVVAPAAGNEAIPSLDRLDDATVRVEDQIICFDPQSPHAAGADILVNASLFRPGSAAVPR